MDSEEGDKYGKLFLFPEIPRSTANYASILFRGGAQNPFTPNWFIDLHNMFYCGSRKYQQ